MPERTAVILAGPNGAGKSTVQPYFLPPTLTFVSADHIARTLREAGGAESIGTDIAAGRLLLDQLDKMVERGKSFATESNLANKSLLQRIPEWQCAGYRVILYYFWLPSPEFAIERVRQRVMAGGQNVAPETVRKRYHVGLSHFLNDYSPTVDHWRLYDASGVNGPALIEEGRRQVRNRAAWLDIKRTATKDMSLTV